MNKKFLFLIALVVSFVMISCNDDECDHSIKTDSTPTEDSVVGAWYEEAENEEMRFSENGTFYDRYANYAKCEQVEGRYEYDSKNHKLTYMYTWLGQSMFADWTVKDKSEMGFTIYSSTVGDHVVEKIVESYELKVGETANIEFSKVYPDYSVISYTSNNERIASVTPEGLVKAEGEKGITYIKVHTSKCNVWVKVIVGDNCAELWHDYVGLIGLDYKGITKALWKLGDPYSGEDGYSFGFLHNGLHDVAEITKVFLCPEERTAIEIHLLLKESVPEAQVLSYMDSRYYKIGDTDAYIFYSSLSDPETSKAIIAYNKSEKSIIFNETQHFLHYPHVKDLWTDFVPLFGSNKTKVKETMDNYGYSFVMSNYDYSKDGSDYYNIPNNKYARLVGFVFNPDRQMSEFWVYMDRNSDANEAYSYLLAKYKENEAEASQYKRIFYNDDKSVKVTFDLVEAAVIYTNLTMKQHEANNEILGDYYQGLGQTYDQIVAKYGAPFTESEKSIAYIAATTYIDYVFFYFNQDTNKCYGVGLYVSENAAASTIVDYLNSKYNVFASGTAADGSKYAWTDGPNVAESTMGITYRPQDRSITYVALGATANAPSRSGSFNGLGSEDDISGRIISEVSGIHNDIRNTMEGMKTHKSRMMKEAFEKFNR